MSDHLVCLLKQVARRDEQAFIALYDAVGGRVFGLLVTMLKHRGDAEEAFQEIMLEVWNKAASYNPALGSPMTWVLMIARSRAIDAMRRLGRQRGAAPGESGGRVFSLEHEDDLAEATDTPETGTDEDLRDALRRLPAECRSVIELSFFRGLSHPQIAAMTGQPKGTIKSRIRRGMQELRTMLAEDPVLQA